MCSTLKSLKTVDKVKDEILRLCKELNRVDNGDVDFKGEAYRLFLINCCSRNNTTASVIEAELEVAVECPIDIADIYRAAADDQHQQEVIDTYFRIFETHLEDLLGVYDCTLQIILLRVIYHDCIS